jgi:hypothetical protein
VTVRLDRRILWAAIACVLIAGAVVGVVFATRDSGPAAGSLAGFQAALHPADVAAAENDLGQAADAGAAPARLLTLTNRLLDLVRDDSDSARRDAVDKALAAVTGAGCLVCEQALEQARP